METVIDSTTDISAWNLSTNGDKLFSADAVIDAYYKGIKDGLEQSQKLALQQLETNIKKSSTHTTKVIEYLVAQNLCPISAHLKIESFDGLQVLITLPEKDFLSDNISSAYDFVTSIEEGVSEELYKIRFSFIHKGESFDQGTLKSDGFGLKREFKKSNTTTSKK